MIYYVYPEGVFGLEAPLGYVEGNVIVFFEGYIFDIVYGMVVGQCAVYKHYILCRLVSKESTKHTREQCFALHRKKSNVVQCTRFVI